MPVGPIQGIPTIRHKPNDAEDHAGPVPARPRPKTARPETHATRPQADHAGERQSVTFVGGHYGPWRVLRMDAVRGEPLEWVGRIAIVERFLGSPPVDARWILHGVTSHERYTTHVEHETLVSRQPILGRREATRAALIPISKSSAWWALAQDERRTVFEERSAHIRTGLEYLPAVARRLYHGRDQGEPFDFLTWFEYAPRDADAFDELLERMRSSEEWRYVEREVDIRLEREPVSESTE